jgi:hypothetical protein
MCRVLCGSRWQRLQSFDDEFLDLIYEPNASLLTSSKFALPVACIDAFEILEGRENTVTVLFGQTAEV